jgi:hypothetical protein
MRKTLLLAAVLLVSISSICQTASDSITVVKVFGGRQFFQNDKKLKTGQLVKLMESNEQALKYIKSAQTNNTVSAIIGYAGGFMIGWPIGTAIGGGDPNWTLAAVGAGLVAVSIPLSIKATKQTLMAVDLYNQSFRRTSSIKKPELQLQFRGNSVGIALRF